MLYGQDHKKNIYLEDPTNTYLDYLINSGKLETNFVLWQPYQAAVLDSVGENDKATTYFKKFWLKYYKEDEISFQLDAGDELRSQEKVYNRWAMTGGVHFFAPHVSFANRTSMNQDYKHDPNYAGDLSESDSWLWGRVNDAYINAYVGNFDFFFGRMHRNWGPIGSPSLVFSNHPYTYDHFLFSYTYKILRIALIFGRLEDLNALVLAIPGEEPIEVKGARKFFAGHRLDLSFSKNFQVGLTEMATYGGEGRDFEFGFLNPMNFYYGLQRNDRNLMSGLWGIDLFYKPYKQLTLYGQFIIDDIVVNNEPDQDDRAQYPDRLGIILSARTGDILFNGLNMELTYTRISNRTYQSRYTYENYHYRGLSRGYPCASCEEFKFKFGYWDLFPFYFENDLVVGRYGDVALTDVFLLDKEPFPVEPVTDNLINTTLIRYFASRYFQFHIRAKYSKEATHYSNRIDPYKGWQFALGVRLILSAGLNL
jgi:hypothetical protein